MRIPKAAVGLIVTTALVVASGCETDQKQDVQSYRQVLELGPPPTFEVGEPLDLATAVRLTNFQNERLSIEGENYLQAMVDHRSAIASFLPTVDLSAIYSFGGAIDADNLVVEDATGLDAPVSGQMTLFDGFRNINRLKSSDLTIEQRRWLLLDVREALLLDVSQIYYLVMRAEHLAGVLRNSVAVQEERVRDIREHYRFGVARPLDVAQTEAQFSQTKVLLLNAASDVETSRSALSFLTGVEFPSAGGHAHHVS